MTAIDSSLIVDKPPQKSHLSIVLVAKQGIRPPDGYFFTEKDGSVQKGRSWNEVFQKVAGYRRRNKFALGDVQTEVIAQAQKRFPDGFWESNPPRNINIYAAQRKS